jgi:hypothetical protein
MPSNTRRIRLTSWGEFCVVCRHFVFTNSSFLLLYKPNSQRVSRVQRVWLAQVHTQAFQTPSATWWVPNGQAGPCPSPNPMALAHLYRAYVQPCSIWFFYSLIFQIYPRACSVLNFHAPYTHPQTEPRAFNTASMTIMASKSPPTSPIKWLIEQYTTRYECLSTARAWRSKRRV